MHQRMATRAMEDELPAEYGEAARGSALRAGPRRGSNVEPVSVLLAETSPPIG